MFHRSSFLLLTLVLATGCFNYNLLLDGDEQCITIDTEGSVAGAFESIAEQTQEGYLPIIKIEKLKKEIQTLSEQIQANPNDEEKQQLLKQKTQTLRHIINAEYTDQQLNKANEEGHTLRSLIQEENARAFITLCKKNYKEGFTWLMAYLLQKNEIAIEDKQELIRLASLPEDKIDLQYTQDGYNVAAYIKKLLCGNTFSQEEKDKQKAFKLAQNTEGLSFEEQEELLSILKHSDVAYEDFRDDAGNTLLHWIVKNKIRVEDRYSFRKLVSGLHVLNNQGETPLSIAVTCNCEWALEKIKKEGYKVEVRRANRIGRDIKRAETLLHELIKLQDDQAIKRLLDMAPYLISESSKQGYYFVQFAVQRRCPGMVDCLLGYTHPEDILHWAASQGFEESVAAIAKHYTEDINKKDRARKTALEYASEQQSWESAKVLLDHGADFQCTSLGSYSTLLMLAVREGNNALAISIINTNHFILEPGDKQGKNALHHAVEKNREEIVKLLLEAEFYVNIKDKNWKTPLHYAIEKEQYHLVQLLIDKGAKTDYRDKNWKTPLHYALEKEQYELAKILLDKAESFLEISCNDGKYLLHLAFEKEQYHLVQPLIEKGADINCWDKNRETPLHYAFEKKQYELAKILIDKVKRLSDIGCKDSKHLLHLAFEKEQYHLVQPLIEKGADINCWDKNRETPLHYAFEKKQYELAKILIDKVKRLSDIGCKDSKHLLHLAFEKEQYHLVQPLIEKGADINSRDKNRKTPLHHAVEKNNFEMVKLLVKEGAKVDYKDIKGETPLDYAKRLGYKNIATLLEAKQNKN